MAYLHTDNLSLNTFDHRWIANNDPFLYPPRSPYIKTKDMTHEICLKSSVETKNVIRYGSLLNKQVGTYFRYNRKSHYLQNILVGLPSYFLFIGRCGSR